MNPSGVRFGSADIYAVLEKCFPDEVAESLCVGQRRPQDADERVVLFVVMRAGLKLDGGLVGRIKGAVARELTKRHVPKYVFEVPEIPVCSSCPWNFVSKRMVILVMMLTLWLQVTVNGKKVEMPVKIIISGETVKPSGTLLNPQCLDHFYRYQKIEELEEPRAKL